MGRSCAGEDGDVMFRFVSAVFALVSSAGIAIAAQRAAVFPFELVIPPKEEDFYVGSAKPDQAEKVRLKLVYDEFVRLMSANGRIEAVDLSPLAAEIEAKSPIYECKGCEIDLARKAGAEIAYIIVLEKASDTLLNLNLTEVDVARSTVTRRVSAVVNGNTDDAWLGIVRWVVRNRLTIKQETTP